VVLVSRLRTALERLNPALPPEAITAAVDELPRVYSPELYRQKCSVLFGHVYESYPERDAGVCATAS
jgi:hypothetical protein